MVPNATPSLLSEGSPSGATSAANATAPMSPPLFQRDITDVTSTFPPRGEVCSAPMSMVAAKRASKEDDEISVPIIQVFRTKNDTRSNPHSTAPNSSSGGPTTNRIMWRETSHDVKNSAVDDNNLRRNGTRCSDSGIVFKKHSPDSGKNDKHEKSRSRQIKQDKEIIHCELTNSVQTIMYLDEGLTAQDSATAPHGAAYAAPHGAAYAAHVTPEQGRFAVSSSPTSSRFAMAPPPPQIRGIASGFRSLPLLRKDNYHGEVATIAAPLAPSAFSRPVAPPAQKPSISEQQQFQGHGNYHVGGIPLGCTRKRRAFAANGPLSSSSHSSSSELSGSPASLFCPSSSPKAAKAVAVAAAAGDALPSQDHRLIACRPQRNAVFATDPQRPAFDSYPMPSSPSSILFYDRLRSMTLQSPLKRYPLPRPSSQDDSATVPVLTPARVAARPPPPSSTGSTSGPGGSCFSAFSRTPSPKHPPFAHVWGDSTPTSRRSSLRQVPLRVISSSSASPAAVSTASLSIGGSVSSERGFPMMLSLDREARGSGREDYEEEEGHSDCDLPPMPFSDPVGLTQPTRPHVLPRGTQQQQQQPPLADAASSIPPLPPTWARSGKFQLSPRPHPPIHVSPQARNMSPHRGLALSLPPRPVLATDAGGDRAKRPPTFSIFGSVDHHRPLSSDSGRSTPILPTPTLPLSLGSFSCDDHKEMGAVMDGLLQGFTENKNTAALPAKYPSSSSSQLPPVPSLPSLVPRQQQRAAVTAFNNNSGVAATESRQNRVESCQSLAFSVGSDSNASMAERFAAPPPEASLCAEDNDTKMPAEDDNDRECGGGGKIDDQEEETLHEFRPRSVLTPSRSNGSIGAMLERDHTVHLAASRGRDRGDDSGDEGDSGSLSDSDNNNVFVLNPPRVITTESVATAVEKERQRQSPSWSSDDLDTAGVTHLRRRKKSGSRASMGSVPKSPSSHAVDAVDNIVNSNNARGGRGNKGKGTAIPLLNSTSLPSQLAVESSCGSQAESRKPAGGWCSGSTVSALSQIDDNPLRGNGDVRAVYSRTSSTSLFGMGIVHEESAATHFFSGGNPASGGSCRGGGAGSRPPPRCGSYGNLLSHSSSDQSLEFLGLSLDSFEDGSGRGGASRDLVTPPAQIHPISGGGLGAAIHPASALDPPPLRSRMAQQAQFLELPCGNDRGDHACRNSYSGTTVCVAPSDQHSIKLAIAKMAAQVSGQE